MFRAPAPRLHASIAGCRVSADLVCPSNQPRGAAMAHLSSKDAINELMAIPWAGLQEQMAQDAAEAIAPLQEWGSDTGKKKVSGGPVDLVKYRLWLKMAEASLTTAIQRPPAYTELAADHLQLALPGEDSWSVTFDGRMEGRFRVWANPLGTTVNYLSVSFSVSQRVRIRNFRILFDVRLDSTDSSRPMLQEVSVSPRFDLDLSGLINANAAFGGFEVVARPDGVYQLRRELIDIDLDGLPNDIAEASLNADLLVTLLPAIEIKIDGALSVKLPEVGRQSLDFKMTIPTSVELPEELGDQLPLLPSDLPRSWGEEYRDDIEDAPAGTDWYGPALEIEDGILANLPRGQVYELLHRRIRGPIVAGSPGLPETGRASGRLSSPSAPGRAETGVIATTIYEGYEDTAIWTGHLLAAEAFRYAAAQTDASRATALERARFVLNGISKLFEVTQPTRPVFGALRRPKMTGLFARASLPESVETQTDPPFDDPPSHTADRYYGPVTLDGEVWYGFGRADRPPSRDSYIGLILGFTSAYTLISDPEFRGKVGELAAAMVSYVLDNGFNVPTPPKDRILTSFFHQFHHQLAVLQLGKTIGHDQATELYERVASAAAYAWIPVWGTTLEPLQKYYKFNLSHGALGVSLYLESEPEIRAGYRRAFHQLRRSTRHHRNAYFNLIRVLTEQPPERDGALAEPAGYNPSLTVAEETRACLWEWLRRRAAVAVDGMPREKTPDEAYLKALYPDQVARYEPAFPNLEAGPVPTVEEAGPLWACRFALPVDKRPGRKQDFMWQRSPFSTGIRLGRGAFMLSSLSIRRSVTISEGNPDLQAPGVDYLLAVWMAAYLGVIPPMGD